MVVFSHPEIFSKSLFFSGMLFSYSPIGMISHFLHGKLSVEFGEKKANIAIYLRKPTYKDCCLSESFWASEQSRLVVKGINMSCGY